MIQMAQEGLINGENGTLYYEDFMSRVAPWGARLNQPIWRCVDHLCCLIVRIIQQETGYEKPELTVTANMIKRFMNG